MKLVTRADLARLAGVTPAVITRLCKSQIVPARHEDLVDAEHPTVRAYLAKRARRAPERMCGIKDVRVIKLPPPTSPPQKSKAGRKSRSAVSPDEPDAAPAPKLDDYGFCSAIDDLTAKQISERFGSNRAYVVWLDAYQKQQQARKLFLSNEEAQGCLIRRELVETHVFGTLETLFKRLLTDAARTISAKLYTLAKAGVPLSQAELEVRDLLSKMLKPVKAKAVRVLKQRPGDAPG